MNEIVHTQDFTEVLTHIQQARQKAYAQVNTTLIELYWHIGGIISQKVSHAAWGKGVVRELAQFIANNDPTAKGFSDKNLWRMKQFYETYHSDEKLSPLVRKLSWTHNTIIFSQCKTPEERAFYLHITIQDKYSTRELERQIDASLFERTIIGNQKLSAVLRELHPTIDNTFKDNYVLEFLGLPQTHSETHLQAALVQNMKQFILELGRDFIFIGEEYRLQVGNRDFFIDLLLFHRGLSALMAFELKIGKFEPEHIGQLKFYLEALVLLCQIIRKFVIPAGKRVSSAMDGKLKSIHGTWIPAIHAGMTILDCVFMKYDKVELDSDVKKPHENPSIGVLLCSDKDDEVVEYALSRTLSPTLIAQYQTQLPDKKLIQAKLHEFYALSMEAQEMQL